MDSMATDVAAMGKEARMPVPVCPVELALTVCLSLPGMGTENTPVDARYPNWHLRELHERYREDKSVWSIERKFGPVSAGMVLGDTKYRRFSSERDRTLYLYTEYNRYIFLVTPDSAGVSYRWTFGGAQPAEKR
jgi:hypothetical protein